ncbi:MAG: choice-of-anchor D domain-containing protein, partial [Planctomycetes bacterium]|nr:choice-of-anchor D domain-containing protein [Planctomycetota bacterium]
DGNEELFDFTVSGRVLSTRIIDDSDPGFSMSPAPGDPGGWGTIGGPGREFDYKFNRNLPGVDEFVTWTFNVTPGVYRVSTTWPFGFAGYDEAAPYTIFDGTVAGGIVRGGRNINQKLDPAGSDYPPGSMFPTGTASATTWGRIDVVQITGDTLTVLLQADDAVEFVLADSILIDRLGDIPAGPEIVVVESNRHAAGGTIDYGTTQLNYSLDKTFTITNSGTSVLNITSPINITGPNAAAFQLVSGPNSTEIAPGGTSTFVVRLTAAYEGTKSATISFTTDDSDEGTVNLDITANVLNYRIIDDQDASEGYSEVEMTEAPSGISYQGDVSFANSSLVQPAASATWTFHNMSPGIYYIALTWFDTGGSPEFYSSNTPVTVMDGATVEGSFSVNQKVAPSSFMFEGVSWLILGFFDFSESTVTVTMTNANTNGVILADAVIIARVGGDVPAGNSEPAEGVGSLFQAARASSETIEDAFVRPEKDSRPLSLTSSEALDQALLGTIYWNDDLEDMAAVLAESSTVDNSHTTIPAGGVSELEQNELELVLDDWLE